MSDAVGFIIRGAAVVGSAIIAGATFGTALALGGLAIGAGLLGRAVQGRPSRVAAQQANYDPTATNKVCYGGPLWVGLTGADIWVDHDDISDHESLWTFGVFSIGSENGQGIEAVEKIKIDGIMAIDPVTTGGQVNLETGRTSYYDEDDLLSYNVRLGTDAQGVNTDAQSAASNASDRYPSSFRFRGLCYGAFNMWKHKDKFPNFPRSISALLKGVRVYDPRNPTDGPDGDGFIWDKADTSASLNQHPGRNPALILLDYLTSKRYGDAAFYPERDGGDTSLSEIDEQSFIDAANHCDELVQGGGTGLQPRYSFSDWLDTGNSLEQNTAAILSSMRGILHYQEGRYRLVIPQVQSSVMTLSEDDIIGDWTVRRRGASEVPNRVVAQIPARDGETTTEVQFPDEDDTTFLDQDNGVPQVRTVQLYGVDDPVRAEQLAMISLRESREDAGVSFRATERAAALEVGDVFTLDHAFPGWQDAGAKEFRVLDLTHRPDFTVEVTATEYADSAYSLSSQTRPTPPPGSDLPDPTTTGAPSNLALTSDGTTQVNLPGGDKVPGIEATWDLPTDKGIDRVVVVERENGSGTWNTADVVDPEETQRSLFSPQGAAEGDTWQVGVYVLVGQRLLKSSVTTDTVVVGADFVPGSSVNLLGADAGPEQGSGGSAPFGHRYLTDPTVESGWTGDGRLSALNLEPDDVLSLRARGRSVTGADRVRLDMEFRDASDTLISREESTAVASSTLSEILLEDVKIPANTVWIKLLQENLDQTEEVFTDRVMLNRGPIAAPYSQPPSTGDLIGSHTVDVDSAGNVLVSGRRRADVQTVYFTVGVGSVPSDPTASTNDHSVTAQTWEESDTGINATPIQIVYVKAVAELASGTLGEVESATAVAGPFAGDDLPRLPGGVPVSDVIDRLRDDGQAQQDFRINGFPFNSHTEQLSAGDGESPTFNQDYASTPKVHFVPQRARNYLTGQSGADQRIKMAAVNPSASSFDLKAVIEYGSTTTTDHDDGFSASRNTAAPENGSASISAEGAAIYCNVEDADGTDNGFTVTYDIDTTGVDSNDALIPLTTVHIEYSDAATGGNWTEAGSQSYGPDQNLTDEQFSFSATLSADYDIRLRLTYSVADAEGEATLTGHGEDGTPPGVQFSTNDTALTEESMTPRSTDKVYWEAKEVAA